VEEWLSSPVHSEDLEKDLLRGWGESSAVFLWEKEALESTLDTANSGAD